MPSKSILLRTAFLLLWLLLSATACKPQGAADIRGEATAKAPADLLIRDAGVYTVDPARPWAEAVAVRGGEIVFVGDLAGAEALIGPTTRIISQPGGMVLPGFQDAHIHPYTSGLDHFDCDLDLTPIAIEVYVAKARECYEIMGEREWIHGGGWNLTAFGANPIPHKSLLDAVIPDKPAVFFSSDGHTAWVNSAALAVAGITAETPDPPNGRIDRDPVTGEPVGSLQEAAMDLVRAFIPPPPSNQRENAMRYALDYLHSLGITAMQEASARPDPEDPLQALETYRMFEARNELQMHTRISLLWDSDRGLEQLHDIRAARDHYTHGLVNANTVKMFLDGVVEPHTAALLEDYTDQPGYRGELQISKDVLNEAVTQLDADGFQVHIHVIGDAAVRAALDAFQQARERNGPTDGRHHLAHVEFVDPADIARFAELNVTATFSTLWAVEDSFLTELTLPRVGPERYRWTYPVNSIVQAGGRVALGSDWNVSSPDPLLAIETAVTRVDPLTHATPPFFPQERLSLAEAIAAATVNAAYVNHLDDRSGTIEVGKRADLVVLDRNLFEIEPAAISNARVVTTLFGGQTVYSRH